MASYIPFGLPCALFVGEGWFFTKENAPTRYYIGHRNTTNGRFLSRGDKKKNGRFFKNLSEMYTARGSAIVHMGSDAKSILPPKNKLIEATI